MQRQGAGRCLDSPPPIAEITRAGGGDGRGLFRLCPGDRQKPACGPTPRRNVLSGSQPPGLRIGHAEVQAEPFHPAPAAGRPGRAADRCRDAAKRVALLMAGKTSEGFGSLLLLLVVGIGLS